MHKAVREHYINMGKKGSARLIEKLGDEKSSYFRALQKKSVKAKKTTGRSGTNTQNPD